MKLEDINLQNPVEIGYYDPFAAISYIETDLNSRFPLSNLHWKYHPSQPVRSIPLLPTKLVEEVPNSRKNASNVQGTSKIYLRLMFVKVESVDVYRSQTRPLIMEWLKNSVKDKDVSWAIVMVVPGGSKAEKSGLMKTSIFDKLRMDFGAEGKQLSRCDVKVTEPSSQGENVQHIMKLVADYDDDIQKLEDYNQFCTTLKALLLETFDLRYSKSSRFIEALTPHIDNFESRIKIFLEKLKLAQILNDMRCFSESLELCEELSSELKGFLEKNPHPAKGGVLSVPYIDNLENFSIETSLAKIDPCIQVSDLLYNGQSIEPFEIKLGLFLKLSNNLQSLANFASSISISSVHIATLLKELVVLLNEGLRDFSGHDNFLQWSCAMCDFYLKLPLAKKLIELDAVQSETNNGDCNAMEILEYNGEIKLLKRFILDKMAAARGLELPQVSVIDEKLEDVSLEDVSLEGGKDTAELVITYPPIAPYFQNQQAYDKSFEALSISAMQDFARCERIKTVDLISIDLAFLHFKRKQYQEAFDIFSNSYEYFSRNGWNLMGGVFLEMYLECLRQLEPENTSQIVSLSLDLFATLRAAKNSEDINNFHLFKSIGSRQQILNNMCEMSRKVDKMIIYPLENLFSFNIEPYIDVDEVSCKNFIELRVSNQYGIEFQFSEIFVALVSQEEHRDHCIRFSARNVSVASGEDANIRLFTNEFRSGAYIIDEVGLKIAENIVLSYIHEEAPCPDDTVVYMPRDGVAEQSKSAGGKLKQVFHFYSSPKILRVEFSAPPTVELGSNYLEVAVLNGEKEVRDVELNIANPSHGLNVQSDFKVVRFDNIQPRASDRAAVEFNSESRIVDIMVTCTYKIGDEIFTTYVEDYFDTNLSISISVQDIFRSSSIYAKFQIGCAQARHPVKVTKCQFTCPNDKYRVVSSSLLANLEEPLLVISEQSAFAFYKLIPQSKDLDPSDTLELSITHSNLQKDCEQLAKFTLQKKFAEKGVEKYSMIAQSIVSQMKFDLFHFGVEGHVIVLNPQECKQAMHTKLSTHVVQQLRDQLLGTFMAIFDDSKMEVPLEAFETTTNQILHIPVTVPTLDMLHHVEFQIGKNEQTKASSFVVGEPIDAKLVISSTSRWALQKADAVLASSSPKDSSDKETQFEVTIMQEENWFVSGVSRQSFSVSGSHATKEIDVCLVPLTVGELLFPRTEIKSSDPSCTLDVLHENASETVFVTPDLKSVSMTF